MTAKDSVTGRVLDLRRWATLRVAKIGRTLEASTVLAEIEELRSDSSTPEDFEQIRSRLNDRKRALKMMRRELDQNLERLHEIERAREYEWRFDVRYFERRRDELAKSIKADPRVGVVKLLKAYAAALVHWQLDECRRLAEADLPVDPELMWVGIDFVKDHTGEVVDGNLLAADPLLAYLGSGAEVDGEATLSSSDRAIIQTLRARARLWSAGGFWEDDDTVVALLVDADEQSPRSGLVAATWAARSRLRNEPREALTQALRSTELEPHEPDGPFEVAHLALDDGRPQEAEQLLDQAIQLLLGHPNPLHDAQSLLRQPPPLFWLRFAQRLAARSQNADALDAVRNVLDGPVVSPRAVDVGRFATHPDVERHDLHIELLKKTGAPASDVAAARLAAGREYYQLGHTESAERELQAAAAALTDDPEPHWILADLYLGRDSGDPTDLDRAERQWERGRAIREPDSDEAWALMTRALICTARADVDHATRENELWRATTYVGRHLISEPENASAWAVLGWVLRSLGLHDAALHATQIAMTIDDTNTFALSESIASLVELARYSEARALLETQRRLAEGGKGDAYDDALDSYIAIRMGRYEEALQLAQSALTRTPRVLWFEDLRATCELALGRETAGERYHQLAARYEPTAKSDWEIFAWAFLLVAHPEKAHEALALAPDWSRDSSENLRVRAAIDVLFGDLEQGQDLMRRAIARATTRRELDDFIAVDLPTMAWMAKRIESNERIEAALTELPELVAEAQREWVDEGFLRELERVRADRDRAPSYVGATLALGWLHARAGQWDLAITCFEQVENLELIPETATLIENAQWDLAHAAVSIGDGEAAVAALSELRRRGKADWLDQWRYRTTAAVAGVGGLAIADSVGDVAPTDVTIEVAPNLVPVGTQWADEHRLFLEYIPSMRTRIARDLGWVIRGVIVQIDRELAPGTFVVRVRSEAVDTGGAEAGRWFVPAKAPSKDRATRAPASGSWVDEAEVHRRGRSAWDHFEYLARCAEIAIRARIDRLVDLESVADWLRSVSGFAVPDSSRSDPEESGFDQADHLLLLAETIRLLLADEVPIPEPTVFVPIFRECINPDRDPRWIAERIRDATGYTVSPGDFGLHRLAPEFDALLETYAEELNMGLDPAIAASQARRVLAALYGWVETLPNPANAVLVCGVDAARPILSDILDELSPGVRVVSRREANQLNLLEANEVTLGQPAESTAEDEQIDIGPHRLAQDPRSHEAVIAALVSRFIRELEDGMQETEDRLLERPGTLDDEELTELDRRADSLWMIGVQDRSLRILIALCELVEDRDLLMKLAGRFHFRSELERAIDVYRRILTMNDKDVEAGFGLVEALLEVGQTDGARRVLDDTVAIQPAASGLQRARAAALGDSIRRSVDA